MIRSRLGLKALVLSGLLLGLMAFAASAHAEIGAKWKVNGADVGSLEPKLLIKEIEGKSASLAFTTKAGTNVLILCTAAEFDEGSKLIGNGTISLGKVKFTGCKTLLNEAAAANCEAHSSGLPNGTILSEKGEGLIVLDTTAGVTNDLIKIRPDTGLIFAVFELGAKCSVAESINVEAKSAGEGIWIKDCKGNTSFLTEAASHLIEEALEGLKALGVPAKIVGSAILELGGAHNGLKWAGFPV